MEEILHHMGFTKPCEEWDKLPINWCRLSSINRISPSPHHHNHHLPIVSSPQPGPFLQTWCLPSGGASLVKAIDLGTRDTKHFQQKWSRTYLPGWYNYVQWMLLFWRGQYPLTSFEPSWPKQDFVRQPHPRTSTGVHIWCFLVVWYGHVYAFLCPCHVVLTLSLSLSLSLSCFILFPLFSMFRNDTDHIPFPSL